MIEEVEEIMDDEYEYDPDIRKIISYIWETVVLRHSLVVIQANKALSIMHINIVWCSKRGTGSYKTFTISRDLKPKEFIAGLYRVLSDVIETKGSELTKKYTNINHSEQNKSIIIRGTL